MQGEGTRLISSNHGENATPSCSMYDENWLVKFEL